MDKFCVFCDQKPEHKNSEHVVPQWLIELTGNPKRIGTFGFKDFWMPESGKRTFSFDSLKFPSCESCNTAYSQLEANVKPIVLRIHNEDSLSAPELSNLLDWFDKIRVGLWLGFYYLQKNPGGITPNFYIGHRLRQSDRMLVIFKGDSSKEGLNFIGCDQPSFLYTPSCFCLRINNYCFINISYFGLVSRRIGFPYIENPCTRDDGHIQGHYVEGRNRIMNPILRKRFSIQGTELYQPIFRSGVKNPVTKKYFDTEYVHKNSMFWEEGIGKVFINNNSGLQEYPTSRSKMWISGHTYVSERLLFEMQLLIFELQTYVEDLSPSLELFPKDKRREMKHQIRSNKRYNTKMISFLKDNAQEDGLPPLTKTTII